LSHKLWSGKTETGKSTVAKIMSAEAVKIKRPVLVYDIELSKWPEGVNVTDDPDLFLDVFWRTQDALAFIDESGESVGRNSEEFLFTATRGRKGGSEMNYLVQDPMLIDPQIRRQCTMLLLFKTSATGCKALADEFTCPEALKASGFMPGRFIFRDDTGDVTKHYRCDFATKKIYTVGPNER